MGVEAGDVTSLEAGATRSPDWVLGMLADLEGDPGIAVVRAPDEAFMLESGSASLCRGMDTPYVRGDSSLMCPCSISEDRACSREYRVAKGQTGALFLLSVIGVVAFFVGLPDIRWGGVLNGRVDYKASWEIDPSLRKSKSQQSPYFSFVL